MSVTLVNNSPQLTVSTAGTRGLTGAHVVNAEFSGSDLIITLSDGTVVNAGGAVLSSSGSNNWVGQQAIDGNVIISGSFIVSGSNTFVNIGPTILSGSVDISGSTTITGSLIISGGTINVIGTNLISASQGVTLANTTGYSVFSSSLSQSISHSAANLSSSIGSLSGSVAGTIDSKFASVNVNPFVSRSTYNNFTSSTNNRLNSLEIQSGSVRSNLTSFTQSQELKNSRYEVSQSAAIISASVFNDVSASYVVSASSLGISSSALLSSASSARSRLNLLSQTTQSLNLYTQSNDTTIVGIEIATSSLFVSASSLGVSASNHESRLDAIENISSSWGASTDVSGLNAYATSSLASIVALQSTASVLVAYTTSSDNDINSLEISASSLVLSASALRISASTALTTNNNQASSITALNSFSESISSVTNSLQNSTSSLNAFTSSANNSLNSLAIISASLLVSASSLEISASSLRTSASNALITNNVQSTILNDIRAYTSSLKDSITVSGSDLTILGNLIVQGDTTTLNTATLIVEDKLIVIASGSTNSTDANGAGIYIEGADAYVSWSSVRNRMEINKNLHISGNITLGGNVDGVEVSQLSSSFNSISSSYLVQSASINTTLQSLGVYTSSNTNNISAIHTSTASLNAFTTSVNVFSESVETRLDDLEASIGGGGTGISVRVGRLETSASLSAVTNSIQSNQISALGGQIGLLNQTASNLVAGAAGTINQLNALNTSASAIFESASSLRTSASLAANTNNQQTNKITLLENFTGSTFINYSESVSQSIAQLSASIGGGSIGTLVNGLTSSVSSLTITQSAISFSFDNFSSSYLQVSSSFRSRINLLQIQSASYLDFVSGSRSGSFPSFPPFSASVEQRFNAVLTTINDVSNSAWLDSDQVTYSASVALIISASEISGSRLSSSIWNTGTGLSRSIYLSISESFRSASDSINSIVVGTGFISRPEFNLVTSSFSASISASNTFSASVTRSINNNVLSASALQTTASNLSAYTSSIQTILVPTNSIDVLVKNNLYVSGTITTDRFVVNTTIDNITASLFSNGSNTFGDNYSDAQTINGTTIFYGRVDVLASASNPVANPVWLNVNSSITASGIVSASGFIGTFDGAFSGSSQTNISETTGFSNFTSSISESINTATSSLSSLVSSSIGLLSASVASINASLVTTESLNIITSSLYDTTQSLNNSVISLYAFSASIIATSSLMNTFTSSVNSFSESVIATGSLINTFTESVNTFTASVIATGSIINTFTSSINTYTSSLKGAIQPNGSDLNVSGNLFVSGNIVAQNYIVSSSVTYMTTSFSSGSTTFGNDVTDNHNFTGSVYVVGSISSSATITAATHSGFILSNNNVVSSSEQFVDYGALLTSSVSGEQAVSGTLIVSGTSLLTGSVGVDLTGVESGSFQIKNGATRIDSILFVSDNDYVANTYVGGDIRVGDYLAGGYTAHYDGGVQITGSLRVNAGQNGSGSYFTGSVWITENEAVSGNLQVVGNSSVSGNFIATTISASSAVTASSLRIEGLTRINGEIDIDTTQITIGAGGNAVVDETRLNTLNLRVDSDTFFNSNVTAISGSTRVKSLAINDLSESRIPYVDSTDTLVDSANFTYNGVTFKIGGGRFEVDDTTGNIRTSGSLSVGALNISNNLNVAGAVGLQSTLTVTGSTLISSSLRATSTASFGALTVTGSTILNNRLQVGTSAAISGTLGVSGAVALSSSLFVSGNITASANVNISGDVAITGSLNAVGPVIAFGNSMTDNIYLSGNLEITGSITRNTTNLKATGSNNPADAIYRLTEAQAWSASFVSESTLRTPDEYLEYFVGQGSNKRRYITPVWLDETLYADDYFDISVTVGADSDYVF
jgi:hypothetical protein